MAKSHTQMLIFELVKVVAKFVSPNETIWKKPWTTWMAVKLWASVFKSPNQPTMVLEITVAEAVVDAHAVEVRRDVVAAKDHTEHHILLLSKTFPVAAIGHS